MTDVYKQRREELEKHYLKEEAKVCTFNPASLTAPARGKALLEASKLTRNTAPASWELGCKAMRQIQRRQKQRSESCIPQSFAWSVQRGPWQTASSSTPAPQKEELKEDEDEEDNLCLNLETHKGRHLCPQTRCSCPRNLRRC